MIKVEADKTMIKPGEIVRFTGYAEPVEDIIMDVYVNNVKVAEYTIYIETLGINYIDLKPSILGDVVSFKPYGAKSGEEAEPITITTVTAPPGAYKLTLSASKTSDIETGELVTFTVKVEPAVAYGVKLKAYIKGEWKGVWDVFTDSSGVGSIELVPSVVGNVVDWQAEDAYGNRSNTVTTTLKGVSPPMAWAVPLLLIGGLVVLAGVAVKKK